MSVLSERLIEGLNLDPTIYAFILTPIRSEQVHRSNNGPGRARLLLKNITIELFGPMGPKIGTTGPQISIVIVIGPDSAEPGLLLLLLYVTQ